MLPRRIILLIICTLLLFLGIYTWNQRTGQWDRLCAAVGLEFTGGIMRGLDSIEDSLSDVWNSYVDLRDVRRQNDELRERLRILEQRLAGTREERAELERLRRLMHLEYPASWPARASRVLAWRMGPNAALSTIMLSSGYMSGAAPGTPVTSWAAWWAACSRRAPAPPWRCFSPIPARAWRSSRPRGACRAYFRAAAPDCLSNFVSCGRTLPCAWASCWSPPAWIPAIPRAFPWPAVTAISTGGASRSGASVLEIQAEPLVDFHSLEEVFLLQRPADSITPESDAVYTRRTPVLEKPEEPAPEAGGAQ